MKLLIDKGALVFAKSELLIRILESPCESATKCEMVERRLAEGEDLNRKWNAISPLDAAISSGCLEAIKLLVRKGASITSSDGRCLLEGPLQIACEREDVAEVQAMLEVGSDRR